MNGSSPMVEVYGEYTLHQTGEDSGYVDVETDRGMFRIEAGKPATWRKLKKAVNRHPKPALIAYVSVEDGVPVLKYADWRDPSEHCSAGLKGTYLGQSDSDSWPGYSAIRVDYRNRSQRTGTKYEGEVLVHVPDGLLDKLPAIGDEIKISGHPLPHGSTTRVSGPGQTYSWPDLRIIANAVHSGQGWFHRSQLMAMVPPDGLEHCGPCDRYLPEEEFYRRKDGKIRKPCRQCALKSQAKRDRENRDQIRARQREAAAQPEARERVNARRRRNGRKDRYVRAGIPGLQIAEHRGVVIQHRGELLDREIVHHVDHDPLNNAINNLWVFASQSDHKRHEKGGDVQPVWRGDLCRCPICSRSHSSDGAAA